jgi:hypothetical protein
MRINETNFSVEEPSQDDESTVGNKVLSSILFWLSINMQNEQFSDHLYIPRLYF